MIKRTFLIGALLLIPLAKPLFIKTGVLSTATTIFIFNSGRAIAETAEFYDNRALDKLGKGKFKGAISDFTKAIKINPDQPLYYLSRGSAKSQIGDINGACSDFNQYFAIYPAYARKKMGANNNNDVMDSYFLISAMSALPQEFRDFYAKKC